MKTYTVQLIELFEKAQKELIKIILENRKEREIILYKKRLLKKIENEIKILKTNAIPLTEKFVKDCYVKGVEKTLQKLGKDEKIIFENLSEIHKKAIQVYIKNLNKDLDKVCFFVGRQITDNIQKITNEVIGMKLTTRKTIKEVQKKLKEEYTKKGITAIKTKNNRYLRLDNYSKMAARTINMEIQNNATILQVQELKYDLVKMSFHNGSCPVCRKYENRIYSISGKDKRFPKLNIPFSNGFAVIHPNCRHTLEPYIPKFNNIQEDIARSNQPFAESGKNERKIKAYYDTRRPKAF